MCLSPEADVIAAIGIGVVAVDTLRRNKNPDAQAIALIPAIFAFHSIFSAVMWWNLRGQISPPIGTIATWMYIFIAFVLWPIYIPLALRRMESIRSRRNIFFLLFLAGLIISSFNLWFLATDQFIVTQHDWFVSFATPSVPLYLGWFYGLSTCVSMFASSHRELMWWGVVNIVGISAIELWAENGLPSLWCFWAAITTVFINWFIRHHAKQRVIA